MVIISFFKCCTRQPDICDLFFSKDTVALYMMQLERQFPSSGHLVGCLQLHVIIIKNNFFLFIYLILKLLNLFSFGKYFLKSLKNSFPMFVETWLLKGGLYQMMLRFLFFCLLVC